MAIRDGVSIELDEERAREKQEASGAGRTVKGRGKAVPQGGPNDGTIRRKPSVVLAVLAIVFIFMVASAYAFFGLRQNPPEPRIDIGLEKTAFSFCETVNVTVRLSNPSNGILREYDLGTSQKFQLDIKNQSGDVVAAYNSPSQPGETHLSIKPGESIELDTFRWNQTIGTDNGTNVTYIRATPGMYVIKASFWGHPDIWAQRNFVLD